jgi:hypothetical protein
LPSQKAGNGRWRRKSKKNVNYINEEILQLNCYAMPMVPTADADHFANDLSTDKLYNEVSEDRKRTKLTQVAFCFFSLAFN